VFALGGEYSSAPIADCRDERSFTPRGRDAQRQTF
jgi:hypothetical protein